MEYLLLQHDSKIHHAEYWNFPKGHIEKGESEVEGAVREIREETGIKTLKFIPGFRLAETYFYWRKNKRGKKESVFKIVIWRMAEVPYGTKVKISREHEAFGWFSGKEAYKKLKYHEQRNVFRGGEKFLKTVGTNSAAHKILAIVSSIPKGGVLTYGDIAKKIGMPKKVRWVGRVLNKNTDPAIPCHRVIMKNGRSGGYNKGVKKKAALLKKDGLEICAGRIKKFE